MKLFLLLLIVVPIVLFVIGLFSQFGWMGALGIYSGIESVKRKTPPIDPDDHQHRMQQHKRFARICFWLILIMFVVIFVKS